MITYTGRAVHPTNFVVPTPMDLAVQLGRLPRFGGATRIRPWSVMHHLLAGLYVMDGVGGAFPSEVMLAWLLHEADEACTGDIPSTWKCVAQREMVRPLQRRVLNVYGGSRLDDELVETSVKTIDELLLIAEMHEVGPPGCLEAIGYDLMQSTFDKNMVMNARRAVMNVRGVYFSHDDTGNRDSAGTIDYLAALKRFGARLHLFSREVGGTRES